jgi:type IV secretory pathway VirB2 component (pilin)
VSLRRAPAAFFLGALAALAALVLVACDAAGDATRARAPSASSAAGAAAEADADAFYANRRIEVIVPFGPGGGSDTWARMLVPHLQGRLGRRVAVQVVNIPGAMSIAGANDYAVRRRHDGRTLLVTGGSTFFPYLLGEPMVRYEFRDLTPLLASPVGGVVFVSPRTGIRGVDDLAHRRPTLIYGGISATGNDLLPLLAFELLGMDVKPILGYASKGATRVAFESRETDIEYQTMPAYLRSVRPLVEDGVAVPLFSFGVVADDGTIVRDPAVPELPGLPEVYERIHDAPLAGIELDAYRAALTAGTMLQKVLWVHAAAPAAAHAALRAAIADLLADTAFLRIARRDVGDYPFYTGVAIERMLADAIDVPPETLDWLRAFIRTRFGVDRI